MTRDEQRAFLILAAAWWIVAVLLAFATADGAWPAPETVWVPDIPTVLEIRGCAVGIEWTDGSRSWTGGVVRDGACSGELVAQPGSVAAGGSVFAVLTLSDGLEREYKSEAVLIFYRGQIYRITTARVQRPDRCTWGDTIACMDFETGDASQWSGATP